MDTCTPAAPDALTAFAVPNPNCPLQGSRFFRVWWPGGLPRRTDHPAYFGSVNVLKPTLSAVDSFTLLLWNREMQVTGITSHLPCCAYLKISVQKPWLKL